MFTLKQKEACAMDLTFLAVLVAFFLVCGWLVAACERLRG
jgi:hypothetical protein